MTACPVPSCSSCTANSTAGAKSASAPRTSVSPPPTTMTTRSQPASMHAPTTCRTIGSPPISCMTLGRSEPMRVPLPAARMIAPSGRLGCGLVVSLMRRAGPIPRWSSYPTRIRTWTSSTKNCCATLTPSGNVCAGVGLADSRWGSRRSGPGPPARSVAPRTPNPGLRASGRGTQSPDPHSRWVGLGAGPPCAASAHNRPGGRPMTAPRPVFPASVTVGSI